MKANPQADSEPGRYIFIWLFAALLPLLTSCAGTTMRAHFGEYNTAYADALNEQMLLNLARLENGHPAYYLAIGAIDDRFTVSEQASVGGNRSFTRGSTAVTPANTLTKVFSRVTGYNASGTVSRSSTPDFQFIPLNNDAVSKQVLQPVSPEVFYTLYQQGNPIDQLMRVMIERVETTLPDGRRLILVNSPTAGPPESYGKFLRACAILRELQLRGYLSLTATNQAPEKIGPVSFSGGSAPGKSGGKSFSDGGDSNSADAGPEKASGNPTMKDYADAQDKGWMLIQSANGWQLAQKREAPVFMLNTDVVAAAQTPQAHPFVKKIVSESLAKYNLSPGQLALVQTVVQSLTNSDFAAESSRQEVIADDVSAAFTVITLLNEGISVQTKVSGEAQARTRLVLRSFNRAMEAVASEQPAFDELLRTNRSFRSTVPDLEKHPVIRIEWSGHREPLQPPLQTVRYLGTTYQITDAVADPLNPNATWNRDIFRLLVELGSQVTVDISKFQQHVFELRTD